VDNNPVNYIDTTGEFKGRPSDLYKLYKCVKGLLKCAQNIEKLRAECQKECEEGQHGGSMYKCAVDKCWKEFQDCLKFAAPGA
jgi:hypothetical protein